MSHPVGIEANLHAILDELTENEATEHPVGVEANLHAILDAIRSGGIGGVQTVCDVPADSDHNVPLKGSDIPVSSTDSTKIDSALSSLNDKITNILSEYLIDENSNWRD